MSGNRIVTLLGDALKAALAATKTLLPNTHQGSANKLRTVVVTTPASRPETKLPDSATRVTPSGNSARWIGSFTPNPLFDSSLMASRRAIDPRNKGIAKQLSGKPTNEADIVLGLDFGTSTVKAVIRDVTARQSYLVSFTGGKSEQYLLPARLFRTGLAYSLDKGQTEFSNLKLRLLDCTVRLPVAEFDDACAFLALVIRHCRGWFLDQYSSLYQHHKLNWSINLGIPARSYENHQLVDTFRRLAWAAANLASDAGKEHFRPDDVDLYRKLSLEVCRTGADVNSAGSFEFQRSDVDVVPEIAAQVHGFVNSNHWDSKSKPYMALMDIGAGTIDTAFFFVTRDHVGNPRFVFYSSDVQPSGVANLHRARLSWIIEAIREGNVWRPDVDAYLDRLNRDMSLFQRIPESVRDYVPGLEYRTVSGTPSVDGVFFSTRVVSQLGGCISQGKMAQRFNSETLHAMPFFLCGGGSRMQFYRNAADELNRRWKGGISLDFSTLPLPDHFHAPGLADSEFGRVSVAYGLSWPSLGTIIRPQDIPPVPKKSAMDYRDRYFDKDMV